MGGFTKVYSLKIQNISKLKTHITATFACVTKVTLKYLLMKLNID